MSIPYLQINRESSLPIPKQIAEQLLQAIRTDRLKRGSLLPTVRELAKYLNVSLETAQKAYHILQNDGWINSQPRHGTYVSTDIPLPAQALSLKREQKRAMLVQELRKHASRSGILPVSGIPLPVNEQFLRTAKKVAAAAVEAALGKEEGDPAGNAELRSKVQGLWTKRGLWVNLENLFVTSGTQQALTLLSAQIVKPGDVVGVPELCYLPVREIFQSRGARVIPIRHDYGEIDIADFERACNTEDINLLYVTPNAHYPTGESWSLEKKRAVLEAAGRKGIPIIEDDYYGELYYTSAPQPTLYSLAIDSYNTKPNIFYISSFSTFAHPNFRLGFLAVPDKYIEPFLHAKYLMDITSSPINQQLMLQLWDALDLPLYLERLRRKLHKERDKVVSHLEKWLPKEYQFSCPEAGINAWVYAPNDFNGLSFFQQCLDKNILVMPSDAFAVENPVPGFQVKLGIVPSDIMEQGVREISFILKSMNPAGFYGT